MFQLMREQQIIAQSEEAIVYDEHEKGWVMPLLVVCDDMMEFKVVDTSDINPQSAPNVVG